MPWVNTTAADRQGNVLYADHSVVPHVTNAGRRPLHDPGRPRPRPGRRAARASTARSPTPPAPGAATPTPSVPASSGRSTCPAVVRRDWVMNANDSFWLPNPDVRLEGFADIIGCEQCVRTMRTKMVDAVRHRPARDRTQGDTGQPARPRARQPAARRGGDAAGRRPRPRLPGHRRDRGLSVLQALGRSVRARLGRHPHLRGVREAAPRQPVAGAVLGGRPAEHPPGLNFADPAGRLGDGRRRSPRCASAPDPVRPPGGARCRWPETAGLRRSVSAAAPATRWATPTR